MEDGVVKETCKTQDLELTAKFLMANGIDSMSDIEMVALQTLSYTSLKDLLPASPPVGTPSPPNGSWHEIPIKNPLVKHAAWAYLQPMSTSRESDERGLFDLFSHCVFGSDDDEGCIGFLRGILDGILGRKTN
ncbi:hypothetical protein RJ641_014017 [Dillenia turbinata]|uniref:Uncharacterized protein n=1 Tax=Dillenia turbinata TaxID=194707 RepID=A0AAN8ZTP6_9MAGN